MSRTGARCPIGLYEPHGCGSLNTREIDPGLWECLDCGIEFDVDDPEFWQDLTAEDLDFYGTTEADEILENNL